MTREAFLLAQVRKKRDKERKDRDLASSRLLLDTLFDQQRDFVLDKSRRKAALCPRRAGKSYCNLVYALVTGMQRPGAAIVIVCQVRRQVKGAYWETLKNLNERYQLGCKFREIDLECHLPNGSIIYFGGADTAEEIEKYRGREFDLFVIDEAKSYKAALLDEFIRDIIRPTLGNRRGTLVMIGTPGAIIGQGLFWAVTTQQDEYKIDSERKRTINVFRYGEGAPKGKFTWSLHKWHSKHNTPQLHYWLEALEEKAENGWSDDDPFWLREYMGEWVADTDALVYLLHKADLNRVSWSRSGGPHGLPTGHDWRYVLGVDLGWHDDSAFVVAAWAPTYHALVYVHAEKHPYMDVGKVAKRVRELDKEFGGFSARVMDTAGAGKQVAEFISRAYGIHFHPAKKTEKCAHIAMLNADLTAGRVQLDLDGILADEWRTTQWGNPERSEIDRNCDDHASDAALYVWRYASHHWSRPKPQAPPKEGSKSWQKEYERAARAKLRAESSSKRNKLDTLRKRMDKLPSAAERPSLRYLH